jgi:hypothetical protein
MIFAAPAQLRRARNRSPQGTSAFIAEQGDGWQASLFQFMSDSAWLAATLA